MKFILICTLLLLPTAALAADFVPLAPIPPLEGKYEDISQYVNAVFNLAISISAVLAVIMIIWHGIEYMTQDAVTEKKDHLTGIRSAVFGLILLLLSWLILFVINPQILDLAALESSLGADRPSTDSDVAAYDFNDQPSTEPPQNTEVIPGRGSPIIWETGP